MSFPAVHRQAIWRNVEEPVKNWEVASERCGEFKNNNRLSLVCYLVYVGCEWGVYPAYHSNELWVEPVF